MKGVKAQAAKLALRGAERTTRFVQVGGENDPVIYGVARHAREQEISTRPADVEHELNRSAWDGGGAAGYGDAVGARVRRHAARARWSRARNRGREVQRDPMLRAEGQLVWCGSPEHGAFLCGAPKDKLPRCGALKTARLGAARRVQRSPGWARRVSLRRAMSRITAPALHVKETAH
jgi:hypothetical protein